MADGDRSGGVLAAPGRRLALWKRPGRTRPNLLLITLDTLRADHVGAYGSPGRRLLLSTRSPHGACASSTRRAAIPLTGPSHATILTGLYPPEHGVRDNVVFALGDAAADPGRDA